MNKLIYCIDPEPSNLIIFDAWFAELWSVKTFTGPEEALQSIEIDRPCLIVTEQIFYCYDIAEFLTIVHKRIPVISVIIVSASPKNESLNVVQWFFKPLDYEELKICIMKEMNNQRGK